MSLTLIAPPAAEPVSLDAAKAHLRVTHDRDDELIAALIQAARELAETRTQRALIRQQWRQTVELPAAVVPLRRWPVLELVSISANDQPVDLAAVEFVGGDNASVAATWPGRHLSITYQAGYGIDTDAVPAAIRQWILLQIGTLYEHRETLNVGNAASAMPHVDGLIEPYRVWSYQ